MSLVRTFAPRSDRDTGWSGWMQVEGRGGVAVENADGVVVAESGLAPAPGRYFHSVAMMNAAAIPAMPIRMFQLPRTAMKNSCWPAT